MELENMRILFDLRNVGLGNQGGSSTLVKSGNTLVKMGHEVIFIDSGKNQHTWTKLLADHQIIKRQSQVPNADFIIATGYKSVSETCLAPKTAGIKCHWVRGFETWQGSEQWIVDKILKAPTTKLVNGICLQKKLRTFGFDSYLIRPGYDFDNLKPLNLREERNYVILGGLNVQGKHLMTKRTNWILETSNALKKKYGKQIKLWMFGMDKLPTTAVVDYYVKNPPIKDKNILYNNVDIWLSTSMLEGLHNPPAEAMMTECPVVGTNAKMSGTEDYLIHNETGIVSNNDLTSFIKEVEFLAQNKDVRNKLGKNARKKILEIGNRETNMQKLVDLFFKIKER